MTGTSQRRHGTYSKYFRDKCTCRKCRAYQRNRVARNRADRKANKRLNHGTRSAYDAGCRCDACGAVRSVIHQREYYGEAVIHNHMTRDIKPMGVCPACDEYHRKHSR